MQQDARSIASPNGEIISFLAVLWFLFQVVSVLAVGFDIGLCVPHHTAPDDAATAVSTMDNVFHRIGVKLCYHLMPMPIPLGVKVELIIAVFFMHDMRNHVPRLRVVFQPILYGVLELRTVPISALISEMLQRTIVVFVALAHLNIFEMLQAQ